MSRAALIVIAKEGFQDHEYAGTSSGLKNADFQITVASQEAGVCVGKFGGTVEADIAIRDVRTEDFDRVAFIGGPGARALSDDPEAQQLARNATSCRAIGAICIAPLILAKAGVLAGKKATVWNEDNQQDNVLREHGAIYTGEAVTVDGSLVTANGPDAADAFGKALAAL